MGGSITTHCRNCNEFEDFTTGVGFFHSSLEQGYPLYPRKRKKCLQEIVSNHSITDTDYEYRVLACPSCNTLNERFYVRVNYDEGDVFETTFRCGKCCTALVKLDKPVEEYRCGNCGSQSLEEFPGINWD